MSREREIWSHRTMSVTRLRLGGGDRDGQDVSIFLCKTRGAWRPTIRNSRVVECRSHPHFSASQSLALGGRVWCRSDRNEIFSVSPICSWKLANNRASPTHCKNISWWLVFLRKESKFFIKSGLCVMRWTTCGPRFSPSPLGVSSRCACVCVCTWARACV